MEHDYANAFVSAIRAGVSVDLAISRLKESLEKRHHEALLVPVLRAVQKILEQEEVKAGAVVTVAKEKDATTGVIKNLLSSLGSQDTPRVVIDETIIGGAVVSYRHRMIDASYKRALTKLYRAITK